VHVEIHFCHVLCIFMYFCLKYWLINSAVHLLRVAWVVFRQFILNCFLCFLGRHILELGGNNAIIGNNFACAFRRDALEVGYCALCK